MGLNHVYINSSIDADSGAGTVGDPYGRLSYAFSQYPLQSSDITVYNVKGTTRTNPETNVGTLPTSASIFWD